MRTKNRKLVIYSESESDSDRADSCERIDTICQPSPRKCRVAKKLDMSCPSSIVETKTTANSYIRSIDVSGDGSCRRKSIDPKTSLFLFNFGKSKKLSKKPSDRDEGRVKEAEIETNVIKEQEDENIKSRPTNLPKAVPTDSQDIKPVEFIKPASKSLKRKLSFEDCVFEPTLKKNKRKLGQKESEKKKQKSLPVSHAENLSSKLYLVDIKLLSEVKVVLEDLDLSKHCKQSTSRLLLPIKAPPSSNPAVSVSSTRSEVLADQTHAITQFGVPSNEIKHESVVGLNCMENSPQIAGDIDNYPVVASITDAEKGVDLLAIETIKEDHDPNVKFCIDTNEEDFYTLENSEETGNTFTLRSSQAERCTGYMEPSSITYRQAYPGVLGASFDRADNTVAGFLKISPRTVKPLTITMKGRYIYWILSGEIIVRSTAVQCKQGDTNYLYGKKLTSGSCLLVPPFTAYTIENRSYAEETLLGYVMVNPPDESLPSNGKK